MQIYIVFERLGWLNNWIKQSAGRYISKKFDGNYFELVLQNKTQSKKMDLTPQEVILLNALANVASDRESGNREIFPGSLLFYSKIMACCAGKLPSCYTCPGQ
ncbi:hypothetical protein ACMYSN_19315 [Klebsiella sp. R445]